MQQLVFWLRSEFIHIGINAVNSADIHFYSAPSTSQMVATLPPNKTPRNLEPISFIIVQSFLIHFNEFPKRKQTTLPTSLLSATIVSC